MPTSSHLAAAATAALVGLVGVLATPHASAMNARPPTSLAVDGFVAAAPTTATRSRVAQSVLHEMTLRQKVGQLFMVGTPAVGSHRATLRHITRRHVGNVMLTGRSYGGTRAPTRACHLAQTRATKAATHRVRLLVATDQEGGLVQVLHGRGFSEMPSALAQGRWRPARLRSAAGRWGRQLAHVGVNMDLAPVEDTVPSPRAARSNPPIGALKREFGFRPRVVAVHGRAFVTGVAAHRVIPTIKHFPGLGRVHANTDTSTGVTDRITTRHDAYLRPFASSIRSGAPVVMMSTAYYHRIDPKNPAAFSPFVIRKVLRGDLAFDGVVMSDDLGNARQVSRWSYGERAVKFIGAGGDLVLTVNPATLPKMYGAVVSRARHHRAFRARVNAAALRVLELKQHHGLL